jgi:hypothetical protein
MAGDSQGCQDSEKKELQAELVFLYLLYLFPYTSAVLPSSPWLPAFQPSLVPMGTGNSETYFVIPTLLPT